MTIFEAMQKTREESIKNNSLIYLYRRNNGEFFISKNYYSDWLYKSYPSGRRILSIDGNKMTNNQLIEIKVEEKYGEKTITGYIDNVM